MAKYVITGGLGTGKTSVLALLEGSVATVAEPGRELIAEHRAETKKSSLDHDPELFVERLVERSIHNYRSAASEAVTVFDRGIPDCVAYAVVYGLSTRRAMEAALVHRYEDPVFVAPPWEEIYRTDEMRTATFSQAEAFHAEVIRAYELMGYELIELPRVSVEERAALIAAHLADRSG